MSDRHDIPLTAAQRRAAEAVQSLSRPEADTDFRARLKADFASGAVAAAKPAAFATRPRPRFGFALWVPLTAAAALAAVMVFGGRLPGPEALGSHIAGTVLVDGRAVAAGDSLRLDELLRPGAEVVLSEGAELDILYPGSFVMRLASGTTITLPDRPRRWFGGDLDAVMPEGEISIRTGPDLAGRMLAVSTPEGRARIYGTLVSIFRNDELTCVCLYEGTAVMDDLEQELGPVPAGKRWVLFADGRDAELLDIAPPHLEHMEGLDRERCDCFGGAHKEQTP